MQYNGSPVAAENTVFMLDFITYSFVLRHSHKQMSSAALDLVPTEWSTCHTFALGQNV